MSIETKQIVWMQFATAALREGLAKGIADTTVFAAMMADKMTGQWDLRFGDAAFLVEGQSECGNCHKDLPQGSEYIASLDGVKFCGVPCLKASGREE